MDETVVLDKLPTVDKEYEVAVELYIAQMNRLAEQMAQRQQRIDRLQAETRAALQAVFAELKRESERHEREKLILRLENEMLRFERRLPASRQDEQPDDERP